MKSKYHWNVFKNIIVLKNISIVSYERSLFGFEFKILTFWRYLY